jgi:hypothetical protein
MGKFCSPSRQTTKKEKKNKEKEKKKGPDYPAAPHI